ncbi:MAG: hypothetical protein OXL37_09135 [Chloroflexota bacterium]|nr:hypothetical protein [Chloroflexota bacterium]MDE2961765.1 hypothetical protein [Chloroflexota bacterium]
MFDTPTTIDNVGERGQAVYDANIRHLVETAHHGKFIAVEPDSGDYIIRDRIVDAMLDMKAKWPHAYSHIIRIGYEAAIIL